MLLRGDQVESYAKVVREAAPTLAPSQVRQAASAGAAAVPGSQTAGALSALGSRLGAELDDLVRQGDSWATDVEESVVTYGDVDTASARQLNVARAV